MLKIDMTSFFCRGWSNLVEFSRLVQNDMPTAMIWLKWKLEVEFQYGGHLFFESGNSYISATD